MHKVVDMGALDEWIWAQLENSQHPQDFVNFARHALGRPAPIEAALDKAVELQGTGPSLASSASSVSEQVLAQMESRAEEGELPALLAASRWRMLGIGCTADRERALDWIERGIAQGHAYCLAVKGRFLSEEDPSAAEKLLEQAVAAGDTSAHARWCSEDPQVVFDHRQIALEDRDPYAMWLEGERLIKHEESEARIAGLILLRSAADANEVNACLALGLMYWRGEGELDADLETARQWLLKGARLGYSPCMTALALVLSALKRQPEMRRYERWAALLGDAAGQHMLGYDLLSDGVTPEEQSEGLQWLRCSAEQGYLQAIRLYAWALGKGRGCVAQPEEAVKWMQKGVAQDDADCQVMLGCAYASGLGIPTDAQRAHEMFQLASLQGDAHGTYLLGQTYLDSLGTTMDVPRAIQKFEEAARQKHSQAALELGRQYLFGHHIPRNYPAAARWLSDAAHWGETEAKRLLGLMLLGGDGVRENPTAAIRWLREAANENDAIALYMMAKLYLEGESVPANPEEGKRLMIKSASLGDEDARKWVNANCPEQPQWLKDLVEGKRFVPDEDAENP